MMQCTMVFLGFLVTFMLGSKHENKIKNINSVSVQPRPQNYILINWKESVFVGLWPYSLVSRWKVYLHDHVRDGALPPSLASVEKKSLEYFPRLDNTLISATNLVSEINWIRSMWIFPSTKTTLDKRAWEKFHNVRYWSFNLVQPPPFLSKTMLKSAMHFGYTGWRL